MTNKYIAIFGILGAVIACDSTRRDWTVCDSQNKCQAGFSCVGATETTAGKCEPSSLKKDAAVDLVQVDSKVLPSPDGQVPVDLPVSMPDVGKDGASADVSVDASIPDAPVDSELPDTQMPDTQPVDTRPLDTRPPDAQGSCLNDNDCRGDGGTEYCVNLRCVACKTNNHCNNDAGVPFCSTTNLCVSCAAVDAGCSTAAAPACDITSGSCVECVADGDCKSPSKAFCRNHACVGCAATIGGGDGGLSTSSCKAPKPACGSSGACVECISSSDCTTSSKPICDAVSNTCKACTEDSQCAAKHGPNPGVCMAHQDGRCATASETIYVKNTAGCVSSGQGGGVDNPYCYPSGAIAALQVSKRVIVIRGATATDVITLANVGSNQVTVIGQDSATINSTPSSPGLSLVGTTSVFVRDLSFLGTAASNIGVQAETGSTLRLQRVRVLNNGKGGILLNGASFDLNDVLVSGNGPGIDGAVTWGGIYVKALATGSGLKALNLVSLLNNKAPGITCSSALPNSNLSVFASMNSTTDIAPTCAITPCSPAIAGTCGSSLPQ